MAYCCHNRRCTNDEQRLKITDSEGLPHRIAVGWQSWTVSASLEALVSLPRLGKVKAKHKVTREDSEDDLTECIPEKVS